MKKVKKICLVLFSAVVVSLTFSGCTYSPSSEMDAEKHLRKIMSQIREVLSPGDRTSFDLVSASCQRKTLTGEYVFRVEYDAKGLNGKEYRMRRTVYVGHEFQASFTRADVNHIPYYIKIQPEAGGNYYKYQEKPEPKPRSRYSRFR